MPKIQGKVVYIDPIKPASEKFNAETIDIGIESETEVNGTLYQNSIVIQFSGTKVHSLNDINIGDKVDAGFSITASIKPKDGKPASEKNPKGLNGISNVKGTSIEVLEKATQPAKTKQQIWDEQNSQPKKQEDDDLPF